MQEIQPGFGFGYWHIFLPVQRKLKQKMTHQNLTGDSKLAAQSECSICRNLDSLLLYHIISSASFISLLQSITGFGFRLTGFGNLATLT